MAHVTPEMIDDILARTYPDAHCELDFTTPLELLVATVLSAQCTDARVNLTTPALFERYPDARAFAEADISELEALVRPTGFFRNKAASIKGIGMALVEHYDGEVPRTLDELTSLPGVGRKTANVVLGTAFEVPGITVDTHVGRIARRLGWTTSKDPVKVEFELMEMFDEDRWIMLNHHLIFHGRRCCFARKPLCGECPLAEVCPSYPTGEPPEPKQHRARSQKKPA